MSTLQAETCLHLATIGGTTHRQHIHAAGQGRAKYLLPRTHIREIYIFFEHPAPTASATLPLLPLLLSLLPCCVSTPTICVEQNVRPCASAKLSQPLHGAQSPAPFPASLLPPATPALSSNHLPHSERVICLSTRRIISSSSRGCSRGSIIFYSRQVAAARELRRSHLASDSDSACSSASASSIASVEHRLEL